MDSDEAELWRCGDCGHTEYAPIDKYAGTRETRTFGTGRHETEREILVCSECGSDDWHPDSVAVALLGREVGEGDADKTTNMDNRYKTDGGELRWELVTDILTDVTDGYLSNIAAVDYHNGSGAGGLFAALMEDSEPDVEPDMLGSRLLKSLSELHSIAIDHAISGEPDDEVLYRLSKFAPVVSKLSDQYAMEDPMYRAQWHGDIIEICEGIAELQGHPTERNND